MQQQIDGLLVSVSNLENRVTNLETVDVVGRVAALENAPPHLSPAEQCVAIHPHDTLTYQRGPNRYTCLCGKVYRKDGNLLAEV